MVIYARLRCSEFTEQADLHLQKAKVLNALESYNSNKGITNAINVCAQVSAQALDHARLILKQMKAYRVIGVTVFLLLVITSSLLVCQGMALMCTAIILASSAFAWVDLIVRRVALKKATMPLVRAMYPRLSVFRKPRPQ